MSYTTEQIKALAEQLLCHPVSRSINEIETAGELLIELVKQRDELMAALESLTDASGQWTTHSEQIRIAHFGAKAIIASVKATP